ncbi:MAG: DUF1559 domain-containing protein, partial [Planctomycetaceae bacterium]
VHILPMLDLSPLYNQLDLSRPLTDPANAIALGTMLPAFRSASDTGPDRWQIHQEGSPGTVLAELPTANFVGSFGTAELEDCEGLPLGQNCRGDGMFFHNSAVRIRDVIDGTSNTFHVGERKTDASLGWYSTWVGVVPEGEEAFARVLGVADHNPNSPAAHLDDFSSYHEGGVFFLFGDGRVRFLSENVDHGIYRGLATRAGGEVAGEY